MDKIFVQTMLSSFTETHKLDPEGSFGRSDGFNMAFAYQTWTGDLKVPIEDERKVTIKAEIYKWGTPENNL